MPGKYTAAVQHVLECGKYLPSSEQTYPGFHRLTHQHQVRVITRSRTTKGGDVCVKFKTVDVLWDHRAVKVGGHYDVY